MMLTQLFIDNSIRATVLVEGAVFALMSLFVLARYFYRRDTRTGSLAWHILCLASFSILATLYISFDIFNQLNRPGVTWRCPLGLITMGTGLSGMIIMLSRLYFRDKIAAKVHNKLPPNL